MASTRTPKKAARTVITLGIAVLLCAAIVVALVIPFSLNTILFRFGSTPDIASIYVFVNKAGSTSSYFHTDDDEEIAECLDLISDYNISFNSFSERMSFKERTYRVTMLFEDSEPIHFTLADTGNISYGHTILKISNKQSIDPFVLMISTWSEQQIE